MLNVAALRLTFLAPFLATLLIANTLWADAFAPGDQAYSRDGKSSAQTQDAGPKQACRLLRRDQYQEWGVAAGEIAVANANIGDGYYVGIFNTQSAPRVIVQAPRFSSNGADLRFRFDQNQPRFLSQAAPQTPALTLQDVVLSAEYGVLEGARMTSLNDKYNDTVLSQHRQVRQLELEIRPDQASRIFEESLSNTEAVTAIERGMGLRAGTLKKRISPETLRAVGIKYKTMINFEDEPNATLVEKTP